MARDNKSAAINRSAMMVAVASCFAAAAHANPTNPIVTNGSASFTTLGNTLVINNAPNTIIRWGSFSNSAGEVIRFDQINAASRVLNRDVSGNPSALLGTLSSNGRVYILNRSGILFGRNSIVDVAGLVASSLNLSDGNFLIGRHLFTDGAGAGSVINRGIIQTPAGGQVYLVAPIVQNHGVITSANGEVILAAGNTVEVFNPGTPSLRVELTADTEEALNVGNIVNRGGQVGLYGALVRNHGVVNATTAVVGENGRIVFKATRDIELAAGSLTQATDGDVNLSASNIAQTGSSIIEAGKLTLDAAGNVDLGGANAVSTLSAPSVDTGSGMRPGVGGRLTFNNIGGLTVADTVSSGGMMTLTVAGALNVNGNGLQDAQLISLGGQNITAHQINLTASNDRRATIQNAAFGGVQTITAAAGGMNLQALDGSGVAQIINDAQGANQTVSMTGLLNVLGGSTTAGNANSGIFQNADAHQRVSSTGIVLRAASTGTPAALSGAMISSAGNQAVDAGSGDISLAGAAGGNASISAGSQTVIARNISLANGTGGINGATTIVAAHQIIAATGDVTLTAQATTVTPDNVGGVRIGGNSGAGTDLSLFVGGNLALSGGSAPDNAASIGSTGAGTAFPNKIDITATGNVTLAGGTAPGSMARIGTAPAQAPATGDITIASTAGSIKLDGTTQAAAIRTAGNVTLSAVSMSEAGEGFIAANRLATTTTGDATLAGPNVVSSFTGTAGGNLTLNNSGPLVVQAINAANAALINAGSVAIRGGVNTTGALSLNVAGALSVEADGAQDVFVISQGGQSIRAGSLTVKGSGGRAAGLLNFDGGNQEIDIVGGNLDVLAPDAFSSAVIANDTSGAQRITVSGGDRISVNGAGESSGASIQGSRSQELSITGGGANQINIGAAGSGGMSRVVGSTQSFTAGTGLQAGGIDIVGADAPATGVGISGSSIPGQNQAISTSGTLRITGGNAVNTGSERSTAFIDFGSNGVQTINAARIELQGGASGNGNAVAIGSSTGNQKIGIAGSLIMNSGAGGGASIGTSLASAPTAGDISIVAGGSIQMNGGAQPTAIRTAHSVTLNAGATISQGATGYVEAGALTTASGGNTELTGPNRVASFSGTSTGGSVTLNNGGPLVVAGINAANAALIRAASVSGSGAITTGTGLTIDVGSASRLDGVIGGSGGLNKNGVGELTLGAVNTYTGDTNVNAGILALGAADQTTTGRINVAGGATFRGSPGTYTNAGVIGGNGRLDVAATRFTNTGTLRPGGANAIGTLTLLGNATLDGALDIEAQGAGAGNYDVLAVTGAVKLLGALDVTPINGYAPQAGDSIVPLAFASHSGALAVSPAIWESKYHPADLTLVYGQNPRDGDDFHLVTYRSRFGTFEFLLPPAGFTLDADD